MVGVARGKYISLMFLKDGIFVSCAILFKFSIKCSNPVIARYT